MTWAQFLQYLSDNGLVRTAILIDANGVAAYNVALRNAPWADPFSPWKDHDALDIPLWLLGDVIGDPGVDPAWFWHSGVQTIADADVLLAVAQSRGPWNDPGQGCKSVTFRSDEAQTGAGKETAPPGGWRDDLILVSADSRLRSPEDLKFA